MQTEQTLAGSLHREKIDDDDFISVWSYMLSEKRKGELKEPKKEGPN